ncbi:diguanylate cyclase (GGDEF)-like protein [Varunaivibrio sulfuroxidans]|uniref:diguanylate cyclase n=2 Tax=Varunaivibrio sulfuroxidans TaxID=1773489 RepID=A0A4V2UNU6_9PROT|nr:diguanylate cyclase (GGDEF)-like protein [Varunaivibrio sulfuroxidans]
MFSRRLYDNNLKYGANLSSMFNTISDNKIYPFVLFLVIFTSFMAAFTIQGDDAKVGKIQVLNQKWQYRWGISPFDRGGVPLWTRDASDSLHWHNISAPETPPQRRGFRDVWFRVVLPKNGEWHDPVIFIPKIDTAAEVYLGGRRIYRSAGFGQGRGGSLRWGDFDLWRWHMIGLPDDYQGRELYVRVHSDASQIGLRGSVMIGARASLVNRLIAHNIDDVIVAAMAFLLGVICTIFSLIRNFRRVYLLLALFLLCASVIIWDQTQIRQLITTPSVFWAYFAATAYFLLPVSMVALFEITVGRGVFSLVRRIWQAHLGFAVAAPIISLSEGIGLAPIYFVFDIFVSVSLAVFFLVATGLFKNASYEARVLALGVCGFCLFLLFDIASAHNFISWRAPALDWGVLYFSAFVVAAFFYRFVRMQREYAALNETFENKVRDRTSTLEKKASALAESNRKESSARARMERLASIDPLTGALNRRAFLERAQHELNRARRYGGGFTLIMMDIDFFKRINDAYGHQAGDDVLKKISALCREACRGSDLFCRYGGEEFLFLLPVSSPYDAVSFAEYLRQSIEKLEILTRNEKQKISMTASFGVTGHIAEEDEPLEDLIAMADRALYQSKKEGRNRVSRVLPALEIDTA